MSIPHICLLIAALLPYIATGLAKTAPGFENRAPRQWQANLQGWHSRAFAAHLNSFEAFPLFAAAVILADVNHVDSQLMTQLSIGFIVARIVYIGCYIADQDKLRSLAWLAGIVCCVWLFVSAG